MQTLIERGLTKEFWIVPTSYFLIGHLEVSVLGLDSPFGVWVFPLYVQTKPVGLPLIRNMQINLLISCIESLRQSWNTWLAPMQTCYQSRVHQVTGVNWSPGAHSQTCLTWKGIYVDFFFFNWYKQTWHYTRFSSVLLLKGSGFKRFNAFEVPSIECYTLWH